MRLALVTPPDVEPVSLAEAKLHLRVGHTADDDLISALIVAARSTCEARVARSFVATTWDLFLDEWPEWNVRWANQVIILPRGDVSSVSSVSLTDGSGGWTTIDPARYRVSTGSPGRVSSAFGVSWPSITYLFRPFLDTIRVRFVAGYGPTADDVPQTIKQAILLLVASLYENRGEETVEMPAAVGMLLDSEQWGAYL